MTAYIRRSAVVSMLAIVFALPAAASDILSSLKEGMAKLKSAGPLAFGPDGVLFVADPLGATVFAIATGDTKKADGDHLDVDAINEKVAALLGTTAREVEIRDLAVNPVSGNAYLSVSRGRGPDAMPVIVRVERSGKLEALSLDKVRYAQAPIPNAPGPKAVGRRNRPLRLESITDLAFVDNRVLVAGLSNEEFASTLRSIPVPFKEIDAGTSVEIYHGAHGKFETRSPVRTFVPFDVKGEPHILAAYTCTPLVKFPLKELKPGNHLKGTTIAELGNRNRPLDMIVYTKEGKEWLLLANSSRGIMKITTENLESAESITERVSGGEPKGQKYETIEDWKGILQLDRLDEEHALVVHQTEAGALNLETRHLP